MKVTKVGKELFSMPVFTSSFAEKFLAEVQNFKSSKLSHEQPNSMNRHGVLLDEIGFQDFISRVREEYIQPQVNFSSGQRNLIQTFQNKANSYDITVASMAGGQSGQLPSQVLAE